MRTVTSAALILIIPALLITTHVGFFGGQLSDWVKPERSQTMVGVLVGFIVLAWQLDRQHQNSLRADATKARNALWLEIYRELADASDEASHGLRGMLTSRAVMSVKLRFAAAPTLQEIRDARFEAADKVIALLRQIEKWEIALGGDFQAFKHALSRSLNRWGESADQLALALQPYIPQPQLAAVPPEQVIENLMRLDSELMTRALDIEMVIWDMRIASQNRLLGGLFKYRVPIRKPGDPSVEVTALTEKYTP